MGCWFSGIVCKQCTTDDSTEEPVVLYTPFHTSLVKRDLRIESTNKVK
jgi:hypothetical protein